MSEKQSTANLVPPQRRTRDVSYPALGECECRGQLDAQMDGFDFCSF
jgi:hypothetical protein